MPELTGLLSGLDTLDYLLAAAALAAAVFWLMALVQGLPAGHALRARPLRLLLLALGLFLARACLLEPFVIPSESMDPTLQVGDRVLVDKASLGWALPGTDRRLLALRALKPGDLAVFIPPNQSFARYVKRCVALPGEVVECRGGRLFVNGQARDFAAAHHAAPSAPSALAASLWVHGTLNDFSPVTLSARCYWMMGDNRDLSLDSRSFGPVPARCLRGQPWLRYGPWARRGRLR